MNDLQYFMIISFVLMKQSIDELYKKVFKIAS